MVEHVSFDHGREKRVRGRDERGEIQRVRGTEGEQRREREMERVNVSQREREREVGIKEIKKLYNFATVTS